jgi:hypothetical protein
LGEAKIGDQPNFDHCGKRTRNGCLDEAALGLESFSLTSLLQD